jgi:hypothetical protein
MTTVTLRGTFSKDERPSNGLEAIADDLLKDQFATHYVVGIVQFAGSNRPGPGEHEVPAVKFLGIEPLTADAAEQAKQILDQARKERGLGRMEDSIPAADPALFDFDGDGHPSISEEAETRLGPDGPHEVPPPSAEEILAARAERAATAAKAVVVAAAEAKAKPAKAAKPSADPFTPGDAA